MSIDDTGERRRITDGVSKDRALELLANLAYEYALKNDEVDIHEVERAILRLRMEDMK